MVPADIRQAVRGFRNAPSFTLVAVVALALGLGANTAIFTVVHAVLLQPLPYPFASRIVTISRGASSPASAPMFAFWLRNNCCFDDLTAWGQEAGMNLTGAGRPELIQSLHVSRDYFHLFGAH